MRYCLADGDDEKCYRPAKCVSDWDATVQVANLHHSQTQDACMPCSALDPRLMLNCQDVDISRLIFAFLGAS